MKCAKKNHQSLGGFVAPQVGLEPTTLRLTAECSAIELLRHVVCSIDESYYNTKSLVCQAFSVFPEEFSLLSVVMVNPGLDEQGAAFTSTLEIDADGGMVTHSTPWPWGNAGFQHRIIKYE